MLRRAPLVLTVLWVAAICAIALYEYVTVDPWQFLGEDRGAIFFRWLPHLVYDRSPFGELVMRLDPKRFWLTLLLPVTVVWILAGAPALFPRRRAGMTDVARSNSPPA
jgi:hypothetical protein